MKPTTEYDIFISHAALDKELALALKALLCDALGLPEERVFCSSDSTSIQVGQKWGEQLVTGFQLAQAVVAVFTPNSIFRNWVMFEAGAAHFHGTKGFFPMVANGVGVNCLPTPLSERQAGSLAESIGIESLCKALAALIGCQVTQINVGLNEQVKQRAAQGNRANWRCVKAALFLEDEATSPFSLTRILGQDVRLAAKRKAYFFGRDLRMLFTEFRTPDGAKRAIFNWLGGGKSREFRITLFDSGNDIEETKQILRDWKREAPRPAQLGIKNRYSTTPLQDVIVVDPRGDDGYAVFCIITPDDKSAGRLQFVLHRRDGSEFDRFWKVYRTHMLKCPEL